jgi:superfamily I DNA/RNA helicase
MGTIKKNKHPIRQAKEYKFRLMDIAREHPEKAALIQRNGANDGKFIFPFGHMAILNNCTRQHLDERGLSKVFPASKVLSRDEFETLSSSQLIDQLKKCFDPWWPFPPLSERQVSVLRSIIHPQIVISPAQANQTEQPTLHMLDLRQERNARSLGEGHRIIYGVAGSGKTVILLYRARAISEYSDKRVLILCYNRELAEYFRERFANTSNVTCLNFHQWGGQRSGVRYKEGEDEEQYGARLLTRLQGGEGDAHKYDAVFIDEAQDFSKTWFLCAKLALKEVNDGDLLIVGDASQSLYRRRGFTWAEAGINAIGRTINKRFDLDKNYRNTREILKIAAEFVATEGAQTDPEAHLQPIKPDPNIALRSGPLPEMLSASTVEGELRAAIKKIDAWLQKGLKPPEIAVLYRANSKSWVDDLASLISKHVAVNWRGRSRSPDLQNPSGVFLSTIHSAKGLQWRAVLVMRIDMMPYNPEPSGDIAANERVERGLMYVAMTRAEEMLAFTRSSLNGFASRIQQLLDHSSV